MRTRLGYDPLRLKFLWLLVPLMAVWANSHGGFVAGLAVVIAYLGCRAAEALFGGGRPGIHNAGWGLFRRMTLMMVVAVLATLLNPYGPGLHEWLIKSLGSPRPEISDWSNQQLWTMVGMKLWLMVACTGFALAFSRHRRDATELLLLGLLLWQSVSHFRHVAFFAIAAGFWTGPHMHSALQRFSKSAVQETLSRRNRQALQVVLVLGLVIVGGRLGQRLSDLQVERDRYPVDAVEFMRNNHLRGRIVVTYDWAQYTIASLCSGQWPESARSAVAFDGRFRTCYPQSIVDMHFDFLYGDTPRMPRQRSPLSPPIDPSRVLAFGQPNLVLLRRFGEVTEQHMNQNTDTWTLLYQDAVAQVWGKREMYDNIDSPFWLAEDERVIHDRRASDSVTWPAIGEAPMPRAPYHMVSRSQ